MNLCKECTHQRVCSYKNEIVKAEDYIKDYDKEKTDTLISPIKLEIKCIHYKREQIGSLCGTTYGNGIR